MYSSCYCPISHEHTPWIIICNKTVSCCFLQQVDYLISQYTTAKNKVIYDLDSKSILGDLNVIQYLSTVTQYLCCMCGNHTVIRYHFCKGHMTHWLIKNGLKCVCVPQTPFVNLLVFLRCRPAPGWKDTWPVGEGGPPCFGQSAPHGWR